MFEVFGLGAEFVFDASGTEKISNIVSELTRLDETMNSTGKGVDGFSTVVENFSSTLINSGTAMALKGIATATASYLGIVKSAEWQDQMVDATRYMTDTSTEAQIEYNKQLAQTAKLLGRTKEEINSSVISYMQMGKATDEAIRLTKNAGYAAVAWDMTSDTVANAFRSIKSSWQVNMEDQTIYEKYLNMINEVGNTTAATSEDIITFLDMAGGALATVGKVSLENAISMVSAARYANITATEFGTSMQTLMNRYAKSGDTYFKNLGVNIKDSTGALIPFNEAIEQVAKSWDTYSESSKQAFLSGFGMYHASTLGKYIGSYGEQEKAYAITQNSQQYDGSAENEFERVTDTYNFAISQLKVTTSDFITAFWGTLLPPMTKFITLLNNVIDKFSTWMQEHPTIMKFVSGFILLSGVALTLGGLLLIVFGGISKIGVALSKGISPLTQFTQGFAGLRVAMSGLMPTMQKSLLSFAKMSISIGLLYATWKYDLFGIRTTFEEFASKLKVSMNEVQRLLSEDISVIGLTQGLNKLSNSNSIIDRLTGSLVKLGLVWKGVSEGWNSYELSDDTFKKLEQTGLLPLVTQILLFKMHMDNFFIGLKEGFLETRKEINDWVYKTFGPALTYLKDNVLMPILDKFPSIEKGLTSFFSIINGSNGEEANQQFKTMGESVGSLIATFLALNFGWKLLSSGITILSTLGTAINLLFAPFRILSSIVKFAFSPLKGAVTSAMGWLGLLKTNLGNVFAGDMGLSVFISEVFPKFGSFIGAMIDKIAIFKINLANLFTGNIGLSSFIAETFPKFGTFLAGLGKVGSAILKPFALLKSAMVGILTVIGTAVISVLGFFGIIVSLPPAIVGAIAVAVVAVVALVIKFRDEIWNGLQWLGSKILSGANFVKDGFVSVINTVFGFLASIPSKVGYVLGYAVGLLGKFILSIPNAFMYLTDVVSNFFGVTLPKFLMSGLNNLLNFGASIGSFFTKTIPNFLLSALTKIQEWGASIKKFFTEDFVQLLWDLPKIFFNIGKDIVVGLWNGIKSVFTSIWTGIKDFCGGFVAGFKDALGIHSPSVVMYELGVNTMEGYDLGLDSKKNDITNTSMDIVDATAYGMESRIGSYNWASAGDTITSQFNQGLSLRQVDSQLYTEEMIQDVLSVLRDPNASSESFDSAVDIIESFASGLNDNGTISSEAYSVISNMVSMMRDESLTGTARQSAMDVVNSYLEGITTTVYDNLGEAKNASSKLISSFLGQFEIDPVTGRPPAVAAQEMTQDVIDAALSVLTNSDMGSETYSQGVKVVEMFMSGIDESALDVKMYDSFKTALNKLSDGDLDDTTRKTAMQVVKSFIGSIDPEEIQAQLFDYSTFAAEGITGGLSNIPASVATILDRVNGEVLQDPAYFVQFSQSGSNMMDGFIEGILKKQSDVTSTANDTMLGVEDYMGFNSPSKLGPGQHIVEWGANMIDGFIQGMNSRKSAVADTSSEIMKIAKQYLGFNSPSEKGEGQHIVEWGSNMISGFIDGINLAKDSLDKTMADVITTPDLSANATITPIIEANNKLTDVIQNDYQSTLKVNSVLENDLQLSDYQTALNVTPTVENTLLDDYQAKLGLNPTLETNLVDSYNATLSIKPIVETNKELLSDYRTSLNVIPTIVDKTFDSYQSIMNITPMLESSLVDNYNATLNVTPIVESNNELLTDYNTSLNVIPTMENKTFDSYQSTLDLTPIVNKDLSYDYQSTMNVTPTLENVLADNYQATLNLTPIIESSNELLEAYQTSLSIIPVIENKNKLLTDYQSELPITTDLISSNTIYNEFDSNGIMGQIITQLGMIVTALNNMQAYADYIASQAMPNETVKLTSDYSVRTNQVVSQIQQNTANADNREIKVTIESGAIQNNFNVPENSNREELINLIVSTLDDNLLNMIIDRIRDIKEVMNE